MFRILLPAGAPRAALAGLLISIVGMSPAQESRRWALEELLPQGTLIYGSFSGIEATAQAFSDHRVMRIFREPSTQRFLKPMLERYESLQIRDEEMAQHFDAAKRLLSGRVSWAMTGFSVGSEAMPVVPDLLVAVDVWGREAEAGQMVAALLDQFDLEEHGVTARVRTFKGTDIQVYDHAGSGLTVATAFVDNLFLVSLDQAPIRTILNLRARGGTHSLLELPAFAASRGRVPGTPALELFLASQTILERVMGLSQVASLAGEMGDVRGALETLGLGSLESVYVASSLHDGDNFDTLYLHAPSPRRGLLALSDDRPVTPATRRLIPETALLAFALRADPASAWQSAWTAAQAAVPEDERHVLDRFKSQVTRALGTDPDTLLSQVLGDEIAFWGDIPNGLQVPQIVVSMAIKDADKARALLNQGLGRLGLSSRTLTFGQHTFQNVHGSSPRHRIPLSPCVCLLPDRLLVSATRSGMEDTLSRLAQPGRCLADNKDFQATMDGVGGPNMSGFWFLDTNRLAALGYQAAYDALPGLAIEQDVPVDVAHMPSRETILSHLHSLGGAFHAEDGGLLLRCRSIGLATVLGLASTVIQNADSRVIDLLVPFSMNDEGRSRPFPVRPTEIPGEEPSEEFPSTGTLGGTTVINPLPENDPRIAALTEEVAGYRAAVKQGLPVSGGSHFDNGLVLLQLSDFHGAEQAFAAALEKGVNKPTSAYNVACAQSLQGKVEASLSSLERAIELGFTNLDLLRSDADLNAVRKDRRFNAILQKLRDR